MSKLPTPKSHQLHFQVESLEERQMLSVVTVAASGDQNGEAFNVVINEEFEGSFYVNQQTQQFQIETASNVKPEDIRIEFADDGDATAPKIEFISIDGKSLDLGQVKVELDPLSIIEREDYTELTASTLTVTGDDQIDLYINGEKIELASGNTWHKTDILSNLQLKAGDVIAIEAKDNGEAAGIVAAIELFGQTMGTGEDWKVSNERFAGWNEVGFNDGDWSNAVVLSKYGEGIWKDAAGQELLDKGANWIWSDNQEDTAFFRFVIPGEVNTAPTPQVETDEVENEQVEVEEVTAPVVVEEEPTPVVVTDEVSPENPAPVEPKVSEVPVPPNQQTPAQDNQPTPEQSTVTITGDNEIELYVNGQAVDLPNGKDWRSVDVLQGLSLQPGDVIAVSAKDTGVLAGLVGSIEVGGETFVTDSSWKVTNELVDNWNQRDFDHSSWDNAIEHHSYGEAIWGAAPGAALLNTGAKWVWSDSNLSSGGQDQAYFRYVIPGDRNATPAPQVETAYSASESTPVTTQSTSDTETRATDNDLTRVHSSEALPLGKLNEVANYLTVGFFEDAPNPKIQAKAGQRYISRDDQGNVQPITTVKYSFDESYDSEQKEIIRSALSEFEKVAGLSFLEVAEGDAQLSYKIYEPGTFSGFGAAGQAGTTLIAGSNEIDNSVVRMAFDNNAININLSIAIHETAHALGLGHAGDYPGKGRSGKKFANDSVGISAMSYYGINGENRWNYPTTLQSADIVALQQKYGRPSDDSATSGNSIIDHEEFSYSRTIIEGIDVPGAPDLAKVYTFFDSDGIDTYDVSATTSENFVNLNSNEADTIPIHFSSVGGGINNVSFAPGTIVENFVGGINSDIVIGNSANNKLSGGGGTDELAGLSGINQIYGEEGEDLIWLGAKDFAFGGGDNDTFRFVSIDPAEDIDAIIGGGSFNGAGFNTNPVDPGLSNIIDLLSHEGDIEVKLYSNGRSGEIFLDSDPDVDIRFTDINEIVVGGNFTLDDSLVDEGETQLVISDTPSRSLPVGTLFSDSEAVEVVATQSVSLNKSPESENPLPVATLGVDANLDVASDPTKSERVASNSAVNGTGLLSATDETEPRLARNASGSTIVVHAQGDVGDEEFALKVDGQVVKRFTATDQMETYTAQVSKQITNANQVVVEFTNNRRQPEDRNLWFDFITIDGQIFDTKDDADRISGGRDSVNVEKLVTNGAYRYKGNVQQATGQPDVDADGSGLTLYVRGDEGVEEFQVLVDGKVLKKFAVSSTQMESFHVATPQFTQPEEIS
ncbi:MAG: carbohydrate-binding domain-containing protein, partial [Planctomycetota bacterium]